MADVQAGKIGEEESSKFGSDVPTAARVWNYWLGGDKNFEVDRAAGEAWKSFNPGVVFTASEARKFQSRVVRTLASEYNVKQFLDVGCGLAVSAGQNTHEVAQSVAPDARVVYVDHDPIVRENARDLLANTTPEGVTAYLFADLHDPESVSYDARSALNYNEPVAVMFMGVLGHTADLNIVYSAIDKIMDPLPSGSFLVVWEDIIDEEKRLASEDYAETGAIAYHPRTESELREHFRGWELIDPGLVNITQWRADPADADGEVDAYGAVARKP